MGALSAFLRGAGGAGLTQLSSDMRRQAEMDDARAQREKEKEDDRLFRQQQAEADREARFGLAEMRAAGGGGARRSGGGALAAGGEADPRAARREAAIYEVMQKYQVPLTEAERMVDGVMTGQNPLTREVQQTEMIDDGDRERGVTTTKSEPDIEKFMKLAATVGSAMGNADSNAASKSDQRAKGRQIDAETDLAVRGGAGDAPAARGALLLSGKGEFDSGGSSVLTGKNAAGSVDEAKVRSEGALAAKRVADARGGGRGGGGGGGGAKAGSTVQRVITTENGDAVAVMRDGTTRDLGIRAMDFNKQVAGVIAKMSKESIGFSDLPIEVQRARAMEVLGTSPRPQAAPAGPAAAAGNLPPAPTDVNQRKPGTVYQTPRGPMKWTGTGWLKA